MIGVPPGSLTGRSFTETCDVVEEDVRAQLEAADGAAAVEWIVHAVDGRALRLSVQLAPILDTPAVLVSVVRWCVADNQTSSVGMRSYEVRRHPFGLLLWVQSIEGQPDALGQPCFRVLHGRSEPCPDCPAQAPLRPGHTRVGVIVSGQGEPEIVSAQSVAMDSIRLTSRLVDDNLFAELVEAKLVEQAGRAALTQRELEVMHLLTLGRAPADVARALGFSVSTAKFHVQNVLRKLGAESRVDLLRVLVHGRGRTHPSEGPVSESRRRVAEAPVVGNRARRGGSGHDRAGGRRGRGRRRSRAG